MALRSDEFILIAIAFVVGGRSSAIDERTTRHPGYALSQVIRKLIETVFGDAKGHGRLHHLKVRGEGPAQRMFTLAMTVVNLRRACALQSLRVIDRRDVFAKRESGPKRLLAQANGLARAHRRSFGSTQRMHPVQSMLKS